LPLITRIYVTEQLLFTADRQKYIINIIQYQCKKTNKHDICITQLSSKHYTITRQPYIISRTLYVSEHKVIISDEAVGTNSLYSALQVVEILFKKLIALAYGWEADVRLTIVYIFIVTVAVMVSCTWQVSQTNLIIVCVNMSSLMVAGGAWVFCRYEPWPYLDSVYYCIITLTTIGFGDYVALQRTEDASGRPEYFVFSLVFILFGLAVLSAAMNLLVLRFLTMNTDDERKDELQAFAVSRTALKVDGDVITSKMTSSHRRWRHHVEDGVANGCGVTAAPQSARRRSTADVRRVCRRPSVHLQLYVL